MRRRVGEGSDYSNCTGVVAEDGGNNAEFKGHEHSPRNGRCHEQGHSSNLQQNQIGLVGVQH